MPGTPDVMQRWNPVVGRWRTTGVVLDEQGRPTIEIHGTDAYEWMAGGHWLVHHVDVMMGEQHTQALELIGDHDPRTDTYTMRAFDASGDYTTMTAHLHGDGSWLFDGPAMRSTLWPAADHSSMSALWERELDTGRWIPWMRMNFAPAS